MSLSEYRRKRDFTRTREPGPDATARGDGRALFVVQLHHASRRHYDFRLQVGDTLKSWAVPKGPSFDPKVKRLAAEVEDHPVSYATFEGEIPKGEYGGGHVALFDRGVWSSAGDVAAQLAKGHLRFELFGERLQGGWHLVRTRRGAKQPEWLLFKEDDAFAGTHEADDLLDGVTPPPAPQTASKSTGRVAAPARSRSARATRALAPITRAVAPRVASRPVAAAAPSRRAAPVDWGALAAALPGARKARAATQPFAPQLARLGTAPPVGAQWLHELKWDGYRLLATLVGGTARLWSRNAIEWTARLPDIVAALEQLGPRDATFDGELIAAQGSQHDFGVLQATLSGERHAALTYVLFDLLHLDGHAVDRAPLLARKALLERVLERRSRHLGYSSHSDGDGAHALAVAVERGFEGIISKRADQPYHGGRGDDWRKTKREHSDEYAVVGVTAPKGSRSGFGSLLLARPDTVHGWKYAGRVGSGFSDAQLRDLSHRIGDAGVATPSVHVDAMDAELRRARWFAPKFVVEVFTRGTGNQGLLRQPSLKAIRMDKKVGDLHDADAPRAPTKRARTVATKAATAKRRRSTAASSEVGRKTAAPKPDVAARRVTPNAAATPAAATKRNVPKSAAAVVKAAKARPRPPLPPAATKPPASAARQAMKRAPASFPVSSPDRVVFPDVGVTKQQVADYYASVMDRLLPEIIGRPLSVIRCPDGITEACFFQKHLTAGIKHVAKVRLKEESGNNADYLVAQDAAAVMELVQFNALEFHPWGAKAKSPDRADRIVFDLDPGPGVAWNDIRRAARRIRDLLEQLGLVSFLRTSGGKGLHVVVPLNPGCRWDLVKRFARGFAEAMVQTEPERYVAVATKTMREGRIFIDYLRNGRGATSVASYSLRARPGAPVAMPLAWEELSRLKRADAFDIAAARRRLGSRREDPWAGIEGIRQDLSRWSTQPPRKR